MNKEGSYSHADRSTETKADSFSTAEVLMFETKDQPFPNELNRQDKKKILVKRRQT